MRDFEAHQNELSTSHDVDLSRTANRARYTVHSDRPAPSAMSTSDLQWAFLDCQYCPLGKAADPSCQEGSCQKIRFNAGQGADPNNDFIDAFGIVLAGNPLCLAHKSSRKPKLMHIRLPAHERLPSAPRHRMASRAAPRSRALHPR